MKKCTVFILAALMLFGLVPALWAMAAEEEAEGPVELVIPHYKAGQNVGGIFFLPQVERFNAKYEGQYHIVIEELPQDGYAAKMKLLAQQDQLPALIEGADNQWFEEVMIANDLVYDLGPWLNSHREIKSILIDDALTFNTVDGAVVSLPQAVTRPIGLFYNETMYDPGKRIGEMTFDEFADSLGRNKIAFMTSENAWTTGLFLTGLIVAEPGGAAMLKAGLMDKVYDYTGPIWLRATTRLQGFLRESASANTLGAAYADAANAFMSKSAAVIANGPWMVNDFTPDSSDKWSGGFNGNQVRGDIYPGNSAIANVMGYRWWIPASTPESEREAALAFLEFMMQPEELEAYMIAEGGTAPKLQVSQSFLEQQAQNRVMSDLATAVNADTTFTVAVYDVMPHSIQNEEFGKLLPRLLDGSFTPAEFLEALSKKAEETRM